MELFRVGLLIRAYERNDFAMSTSTTGPTRAVDVSALVSWWIEVDHARDIVHVDTSCRDVGADEHLRVTSLEERKRTFALSLRTVAVDRDRVDS
ncbi:MAG: hypothetical protein WB770_09720 [Acidimicrobiales bacterium]